MATIQVRNVPERVHRTLRVRAAAAGKSLQEYLLEELTESAETRDLADVVAEARAEITVDPVRVLERVDGRDHPARTRPTVSVVDASVAADAFVRREGLPPSAQSALRGRIHVPAIFPAEVTSALRGLLLGGHIGEPVAAAARDRLGTVRMRLHPFLPYSDRVWALRENLTVYDAWYVAIAEVVGEPLVTAEAAILDAPGLRCTVIDARSPE